MAEVFRSPGAHPAAYSGEYNETQGSAYGVPYGAGHGAHLGAQSGAHQADPAYAPYRAEPPFTAPAAGEFYRDAPRYEPPVTQQGGYQAQQPQYHQPQYQPDFQAAQHQQRQYQAPQPQPQPAQYQQPAQYGQHHAPQQEMGHYAQPQPAPAARQYVHPAHGGPAPVQAASATMAEPAQQYAAQDSGSNDNFGGRRFGAVFNYGGAALSLALVLGLGVWGYKLAVRDVTGIPVVRALEGPMRIQPEDPGGQSASHQGLAVNEVQSGGEAADPSERLVLAPEAEGLADEDWTSQPSVTAQAEGLAALPLQEASMVLPAQEPLPEDPVAAALALADRIAANSEPLSGGAVVENTVASQSLNVINAVQLIPASVPGVKRSPRPANRPADLDTRIANVAASLPIDNASVMDVSATPIAPGTRLVQLGAFDSEDVARSEWTRLSTHFEEYLGGKSRVIEKAQSGGKTFYRLRAMGFSDLTDSRRFCSVLTAAKAPCIPVVTR